MRLYSVKYPVDYVELSDTKERVLIHRNIEATSRDVELLEKWKKNIYTIFAPDKNGIVEPYTIMKRLSEYIDNAYEDDEYLSFIQNNQWLLRFASRVERQALVNSEMLEIQKEFMDLPIGAINTKEYKRVIYEKKLVPIWEICNQNSMREIVEWIIMDSETEYSDKINTIALSKVHLLQDTIKQNQWLLMSMPEKKRLRVMKSLKISHGPLRIYNGIEYYDGKWYVNYNIENIPMELIPDYNKYGKIIRHLYDCPNLYEELYKYIYYNKNVDFIRNNIWLLDLLNEKEKLTIIQMLSGEKINIPRAAVTNTAEIKDIIPTILTEEDIPVKKRIERLVSISPKEGKEGLYSKQIDVPTELYDTVRELNLKLYAIVQGDSEITVEQFIESSPLVLEYWPWIEDLKKYIKKR